MFLVMLLYHGLYHVNGTLWNVHRGNCHISMSMIKQDLCITLGLSAKRKHMLSINFIRMDWSKSAGKISDYIGTIGGRQGDTIWFQLCVGLDGWEQLGLDWTFDDEDTYESVVVCCCCGGHCSRAAKHRVPKKFSTKNPTQKYKNRGVPTQECILPEEVSLDEEDENEADISSQSDKDEDYHPHLVGNGDTSDEPDDIVPPAPEPSIPECRVMPARKRCGKNRKYMSTTAAESSSEEELRIGQKGRVKKDIEKKKMNSNPPTYVRIQPIIKHCQGCRVLFDKSERIPPYDLVFRYVMRREYPDKDNPGQWKVGDKPGNAYFHL